MEHINRWRKKRGSKHNQPSFHKVVSREKIAVKMMKVLALTVCLAAIASAQIFSGYDDGDWGYDNGFGGPGIIGGLNVGYPVSSYSHYSGYGYRPRYKGYKSYGYDKGYDKGYGKYAPVVHYKSYGYGKGRAYY